MPASEAQSTEIALLRGEVMTALARIEGDVRLVLSQIEHGTRRTDELDRRVRDLDGRVDVLESSRPSRDDVDRVRAEMKTEIDKAHGAAHEAVKGVRDDLVEKARRNLTVAGLLIPAVSWALSQYATTSGKG